LDWQGPLALASNGVRALSRIALDGLLERAGRALPATPEALVRDGVVEGLLETFAPAGAPILPRVVSARLPGVDFESSNCRNFLIELAYEERQGSVDAPRTLYAKLPTESFATRLFAGSLGFWALECTFCERIAPQIPIRVPRVYAVAQRGARFVLLLENLRELPGARLFSNRDMAAGTTLERARLCLSAFAEMHAAFHDMRPERREALLPMALHPCLSDRSRAITLAMNRAAIEPARRTAPEELTPELAELCRRAFARWDAMASFWYQEPLTLVHGDSHLANLFEYATPSGPRMGMLDFQAVHWSKGIRDVQYFLIHSLEPDVLAAHEGALIDHYLAELARHGVRLDPAQTREQYRAFSFQTLMVGLVAMGLGTLTEREETVRTVLRREIAAIRRLKFGEWLDGLP
jgi:hypothetical protein